MRQNASNEILEKLKDQNTKIQNLLSQDEFGAAALFMKGRQNLESRFISAWKQFVDTKNMHTIIVSIGSAGVAKQQCPRFANRFALGKVAILNIDPNLSYLSQSYNSKISIDYLPASLDKKISPKSYETLRNAISALVHSGKNVIFMYHTYPYGFTHFRDIINDNLDTYGDSFIIVGSYHGNQPVAVYSKDFFDQSRLRDSQENIKSFINALWKSPKSLSQIEIDKLASEHAVSDFGSFHSDLNDIQLNHLFPRLQLQNLNGHIKYWSILKDQKKITPDRADHNIHILEEEKKNLIVSSQRGFK